MSPEEQARLSEAAAQVVREASQEARLTTREDVLAALVTDGYFRPAEGQADVDGVDGAVEAVEAAEAVDADSARQALTEEEAAAALAGILAGHPGLASFEGLSGQRVYHAPDLLSQTYARILDRKGSPLLLMAGEIRANSRDYPRPVPVELFQAPPFDLTPEDIEQVLRTMAAGPDYQDITFTTASTGVVYLFSTLHLERGYAAFLAQRAESLVMNP